MTFGDHPHVKEAWQTYGVELPADPAAKGTLWVLTDLELDVGAPNHDAAAVAALRDVVAKERDTAGFRAAKISDRDQTISV